MNLKLRSMFTSLVALAVLAASVPALAKDDQHSRSAGSRAVQSAGPSTAARQAQPRVSAPPPAAPRAAVAGTRVVAPQATAVPRSYAVPRAATTAVAVPRGAVAPAYVAHGYGYAVPRPPVYYPPVVVAHPYYSYPYGYYPYYSFYPHFALNFGFYVGYPVPYPAWYNPYAVGAYGYGYGYAVPNGAAYGGLSFDVQPYDAAVFVDGIFIGSAADFGPQAAPLTLRAGLHHVELRAANAQPLAFDITVVPGQVIPYQGTLPLVR